MQRSDNVFLLASGHKTSMNQQVRRLVHSDTLVVEIQNFEVVHPVTATPLEGTDSTGCPIRPPEFLIAGARSAPGNITSLGRRVPTHLRSIPDKKKARQKMLLSGQRFDDSL
jgi:hypothetical protein